MAMVLIMIEEVKLLNLFLVWLRYARNNVGSKPGTYQEL